MCVCDHACLHVRVCVCVCLYLFEGVQVNVDSYLSSEFVWEELQHLPLVDSFLIGPQVVKPLDHTLLKVYRHLKTNNTSQTSHLIYLLNAGHTTIVQTNFTNLLKADTQRKH